MRFMKIITYESHFIDISQLLTRERNKEPAAFVSHRITSESFSKTLDCFFLQKYFVDDPRELLFILAKKIFGLYHIRINENISYLASILKLMERVCYVLMLLCSF